MNPTLLEAVINNLMALMPFVVVLSFKRGIRWTWGRNPKELKPGFHWRIYIVHTVEQLNVVDEVLDVPMQTVMTKDGKLISFSTNIRYRVVDVVKHFCNVQDFVESTLGLAMTHLARVVRKQEGDVWMTDLTKIENSLKNTLTTKFREWGTEVSDVGFTNMATVRGSLRLFFDERFVLKVTQDG